VFYLGTSLQEKVDFLKRKIRSFIYERIWLLGADHWAKSTQNVSISENIKKVIVQNFFSGKLLQPSRGFSKLEMAKRKRKFWKPKLTISEYWPCSYCSPANRNKSEDHQLFGSFSWFCSADLWEISWLIVSDTRFFISNQPSKASSSSSREKAEVPLRVSFFVSLEAFSFYFNDGVQ